jgi:alanyl-tRNA synthetase
MSMYQVQVLYLMKIQPYSLQMLGNMNQFKPIFLGQAAPDSALGKLKRAANSQKCIRAGGKHNDLDDVGKDTYHHTFFEMLGNWSFGDYFKKEAIDMAWELLTEVYGLDKSRLYVTYFAGDDTVPTDEEARTLWQKYLPDNRILAFGKKDNFWEMGDTGPCGPCTEIHYDRIGGRDAAYLVNADDPNVIEIWNLVFIQFNREEDGSLRSLPAKHVDTGMGFERLSSILQNVKSNYDTDVFKPIFDEIQRLSGCRSYTGKLGLEDTDSVDTAYRVVADHIRTLVVALSDGGYPGATGRGYVLRRIIRRAVRFANSCLCDERGFFSKLVDIVVKQLGDHFPELKKDPESVRKIIFDEESKFYKTLKQGEKLFEKLVEKAHMENTNVIDGYEAFKLYETYGFPIDLTMLMAEQKGLKVDKEAYDKHFAHHTVISQGAQKEGVASLKLGAEQVAQLRNEMNIPITQDDYKYKWEESTGKILAIYTAEDGFVKEVNGKQEYKNVGLILDRTNFYAEGGGQVYDIGTINDKFAVQQVRSFAGYVLHSGTFTDPNASLKVGDQVSLKVDFTRRLPIASNHTSTHMLNFALRKVLGDKCDQQGSIVEPDKLRFDFSLDRAPTIDELRQVEALVNELIDKDLEVYTQLQRKEIAQDIYGLRAMFGEHYPDFVRVVSIGQPVEDVVKDVKNPDWKGYSIEFCGGTHLSRTSEAQVFTFISESSISQGTRRVVAYTKQKAEEVLDNAKEFQQRIEKTKALPDDMSYVNAVSALQLDVDRIELPLIKRHEFKEEIKKMYQRSKKITAELEKAVLDRAVNVGKEIAQKVKEHGDKFLVQVLPENIIDRKYMMKVNDVFSAECPDVPALYFGVDRNASKVSIMGSSPKNLISKLNASEWVQEVSRICGGKGGGKPNFANGQGSDLNKLDEAVKAAKEYAASRL